MKSIFEGSNETGHGLQEELNRLFAETRSFRDSSEFMNMMDFIARRSRIAPFNSYLLYLQRPDISCAATRGDWLREGRNVNPGARPLLVLRPFGPIDLVYDVRDTSGEGPFNLERLEFWQTKGTILDREIETIVHGMEEVGLVLSPMDVELARGRFPLRLPFGRAVTYANGVREVQLRPGADLSNLSKFMGILFHEYAHHLLGHMGPWSFLHPRRGLVTACEHDRSHLTTDQKEWEAEVVAFLCCNRIGLTMGAREYLSMYMGHQGEIPEMDITAVLTVAHRILKAKFPEGKTPQGDEFQMGLDL